MRRLAALFCLPVLLLAACGDSISDDEDAADDEADAAAEGPDPATRAEGPAPDDDVLDGIEVTGEFGEAPEVSFDTPIEVDETVRRILSEGDGEPADYELNFGLDYVAYDPSTGEEVESTYDTEMMPLTPMDELLVPSYMAEALLEAPLGSRIVTVISFADFLPADMPETEEEQPTSIVMVADLHEQSEVELENEPGDDLPAVTLFNVGPPDIEVPDVDPPSELGEVVLVEGDGAEVGPDDLLSVNYLGLLWEDGEEFDSSYSRGGPSQLAVGEDQMTGQSMVEGWTEGLAGQTVGSTVLLVVPPNLGYGEDGNEPVIPGDATLIFVVEILDAFEQEDLPAEMPLPEEAPEAGDEGDAEDEAEGAEE